MKVLIVNDGKLRAEIEDWTTKHTYPAVIRFIRHDTGDYYTSVEVVSNPAFDPIRDLFKDAIESEYVPDDPKSDFNVIRNTIIRDMDFGKNLVLDYLAENKQMNLSTADSVGQLQKLSAIKMLLESGAIGAAFELLQGVPVDGIFTQGRKEKFLSDLKKYLGQ